MTGETILVVDDHAPLRRAIQTVLEREAYTVATAVDGADALRIMADAPPNLVVADITMPVMDGYGFYHAVRDHPEWHGIPIVFLTGRTTREERLRGKALGVEDYLTKPLDPEELLVVVQAKLNRTRDLRASTQAELQELKDELARVLSHELRTPLTWIISYTEMAMAYLERLPPEQLRGFLNHVLEGGDRITKLADDFLTIIRLDTGQLSSRLQEAIRPRDDIAELVRRTVDNYADRATVKGLKLKVVVGSPLPSVVMSKELFEDALGRLVDNAIKFAGDAGTQVVVTVQAVGDHVDIAVMDDGIGIAPRDRQHLFERFRQINRERFEQQGIGLGLALARELIRIQHGDITVQSTLGEGSTFTISLPAQDAGLATGIASSGEVVERSVSIPGD